MKGMKYFPFSFFALTLALTASLHAAVPRALPETGISLPGGKTLKLQQYPGKVLAVLLFSTKCAECLKSVELMNKAQKDWAARGFQAVGAAVNVDAPEEIKGFTERYRPVFPIGYLGQQELMKFADLKAGDRPFVPIFMFIDHKGVVRYQYFGNDAIMAQQEKATLAIIDSLLKSRNAGK